MLLTVIDNYQKIIAIIKKKENHDDHWCTIEARLLCDYNRRKSFFIKDLLNIIVVNLNYYLFLGNN